MAGWLAWSLRTLSGTLIACCAYYGINYLNNQERRENIEKTDFKELQESEEIVSLKLGEKKPNIAKKLLEKAGSSNGGTILNSDQWIKEMERNCENNPHTTMHSSDLNKRVHCRLYWGVGEEIDILIKAKNKYILLSSKSNIDNDGWKVVWDKYKKTNPWKIIKEEAKDQIPAEFKSLCEAKSKEKINDIDDDKYKQIIDYCTREKTIEDVLDEKKIKLLTTDGNSNTTETWKNRFNSYRSVTRGARFHKDIIAGNQNSGHTRLMEACKEAIKLKTTTNNYKSVLRAVQGYCKE